MNYLKDIIDHIQDANHRHPNLPVQSHPRLHTVKNTRIFQQTATDYTSDVSHDYGKIFQSELAFSLELTAIHCCWSTKTVTAFKRALNTELFAVAYGSH